MSQLNASALIRDLFAAGSSILPGRRLLVDVGPVGTSTRSTFLFTDKKAVISQEYQAAVEKYYADAGWHGDRIRSTITAFQNPPFGVIEGVSGRAAIQISTRNYDLCCKLDGRDNPIAEAYATTVKSMGAYPTTKWSQASASESKAVLDLIKQQAAVDTWSIACTVDHFPALDVGATLGWSRDVPGSMYGTDSLFHHHLSQFSRCPASDEYMLVMIPCGWSTELSFESISWLPRLVKRRAWMIGLTAIFSDGVVSRGFDDNSVGTQRFWRSLADPALSSLGVKLGFESRGRSMARNVVTGPLTNGQPGWEQYLFTGDANARTGAPWFAYGWSGSADGFFAEGLAEVSLSEGFSTSERGVGIIRINTSTARTYITREQVVELSKPPADAPAKDADDAYARIADINASGLRIMCASSNDVAMDFAEMSNKWAPYVESRKDDIDVDDVEIADGVTIQKAVDKARVLPPSKDRLIVMGVSTSSLKALSNGVVGREAAQESGGTGFVFMQNGVVVDVDGVKSAVACGARVSITDGTRESVDRARFLVIGDGRSYDVWRDDVEGTDLRKDIGRHSRRVHEFVYFEQLGNNWVGGQYAIDNGASDRSTNARDMHQMKGSSFGHRMQVINGEITSLLFEKTSHKVERVIY